MGVVQIIVYVKDKLYYEGMTCMLLGYEQNYMGCTRHMFNIQKKIIVLSRDVIWLNKIHGEYIPRKETTKATSYTLCDKDEPNNRAYVKMNPLKTEVKTEDVRYEHTVKTNQEYRGGIRRK